MLEVKDIPAYPTVKMIKPSGRLDRSNYRQIYKQTLAVIEDVDLNTDVHSNYIVVDMQDVRSIDSCGLGTLIGLLKAARINGIQLALCSIRPNIKLLFELTSMFNVFNVFQNDRLFFDTLKQPIPDSHLASAIAA